MTASSSASRRFLTALAFAASVAIVAGPSAAVAQTVPSVDPITAAESYSLDDGAPKPPAPTISQIHCRRKKCHGDP